MDVKKEKEDKRKVEKEKPLTIRKKSGEIVKETIGEKKNRYLKEFEKEFGNSEKPKIG